MPNQKGHVMAVNARVILDPDRYLSYGLWFMTDSDYSEFDHVNNWCVGNQNAIANHAISETVPFILKQDEDPKHFQKAAAHVAESITEHLHRDTRGIAVPVIGQETICQPKHKDMVCFSAPIIRGKVSVMMLFVVEAYGEDRRRVEAACDENEYLLYDIINSCSEEEAVDGSGVQRIAAEVEEILDAKTLGFQSNVLLNCMVGPAQV